MDSNVTENWMADNKRYLYTKKAFLKKVANCVKNFSVHIIYHDIFLKLLVGIFPSCYLEWNAMQTVIYGSLVI